MARSLDFYQVYFKDEQKPELYPFSEPYYNSTITPFFENSIIAALVPSLEADLISVCSWRLRKKREDRSMQLRGKIELTKEKITEAAFDVAVLTPVSPSHKALVMAEHWHGEPWINALKELKKLIPVPNELKHPIYENHFIATKEVYHEYVNTCLTPVIDCMWDRSVFMADAGYAKRKTQAEQEWYRQKTGRKDWPIAPFILERLFSIWINDKNLNVINL